MTTTPQTVHVLSYSHKHGEDISVYATQEDAVAAIAGIARNYWHEAVGRVGAPDMPESHYGLSDEEVTHLYFEAMADVESCEITAAVVQG